MKSMRSEVSSLRLIVASRACRRLFFLRVFILVPETGMIPVLPLPTILGPLFAAIVVDPLIAEPGRDPEVGRWAGILGRDFVCSGPVDLMKSAKSRVLPISTVGSLAIGRSTFLTVGPDVIWKLGLVDTFFALALFVTSDTDLCLALLGLERRPFKPFGDDKPDRLVWL